MFPKAFQFALGNSCSNLARHSLSSWAMGYLTCQTRCENGESPRQHCTSDRTQRCSGVHLAAEIKSTIEIAFAPAFCPAESWCYGMRWQFIKQCSSPCGRYSMLPRCYTALCSLNWTTMLKRLFYHHFYDDAILFWKKIACASPFWKKHKDIIHIVLMYLRYL